MALSEENEFPHSAYRVWQIHTNKALEKTLPGLKAAQKGEFIIVTMLIAGAFASIGTVHLRAGRWEMMQATLFAIVLAELSKFGSQIVLYRRDA